MNIFDKEKPTEPAEPFHHPHTPIIRMDPQSEIDFWDGVNKRRAEEDYKAAVKKLAGV